jgi:hypothetical protein
MVAVPFLACPLISGDSRRSDRVLCCEVIYCSTLEYCLGFLVAVGWSSVCETGHLQTKDERMLPAFASYVRLVHGMDSGTNV